MVTAFDRSSVDWKFRQRAVVDNRLPRAVTNVARWLLLTQSLNAVRFPHRKPNESYGDVILTIVNN